MSKRYLMWCNVQQAKLSNHHWWIWVLMNTQFFWLGRLLWHINHCRLFNAKSSLYIYIKYIWFGWVWFYDISTIVGYLMPNLYTYIYIKYIWFSWVEFYGISTIVGYLIPNPSNWALYPWYGNWSRRRKTNTLGEGMNPTILPPAMGK